MAPLTKHTPERGPRRPLRLMADNGWQGKFEDPIPRPSGVELLTLLDTGTYSTT